jgi:hypothetical protein
VHRAVGCAAQTKVRHLQAQRPGLLLSQVDKEQVSTQPAASCVLLQCPAGCVSGNKWRTLVQKPRASLGSPNSSTLLHVRSPARQQARHLVTGSQQTHVSKNADGTCAPAPCKFATRSLEGCWCDVRTVVDLLVVQVVQRRGHLPGARQHAPHVRRTLGGARRRRQPQLPAVNGGLHRWGSIRDPCLLALEEYCLLRPWAQRPG